jgi:hypothetical protein
MCCNARVVSGFGIHRVSINGFLYRKSRFTSISEVQFDQTVSVVELWTIFDVFWWFLAHVAVSA